MGGGSSTQRREDEPGLVGANGTYFGTECLVDGQRVILDLTSFQGEEFEEPGVLAVYPYVQSELMEAPAIQRVQAVKSVFSIHKETVKLTNVEGAPSDKQLLKVSFTFSANRPCKITVLPFASAAPAGGTPGGSSFFPTRYNSIQSLPVYPMGSGVEQDFDKQDAVIDLSGREVKEFTVPEHSPSTTQGSPHPLVIILEDSGDDVPKAERQREVTIFALKPGKSSDSGADTGATTPATPTPVGKDTDLTSSEVPPTATMVKKEWTADNVRTWSASAARQLIDVCEREHLMADVYGAPSQGGKASDDTPMTNEEALAAIYADSSDSEDDEDDEDNECVICLSERRTVCVLPCRHMCVCPGCAEELRKSSRECPICRAPCKALINVTDLMGDAAPSDDEDDLL